MTDAPAPAWTCLDLQMPGTDLQEARILLHSPAGTQDLGSLAAFAEPGDALEAVRFGRALAHEPLAGGGRLGDLRLAGDIPAWFIQAYPFYADLGGTLPIRSALALSLAFRRVLDQVRPTHVRVAALNPDVAALAEDLARTRGIAVEPAAVARAWACGLAPERWKHGFRALQGIAGRCLGRLPGQAEIVFYASALPGPAQDGCGLEPNYRPIQERLLAEAVPVRTLFTRNRWTPLAELRRARASGYEPAETVLSWMDYLRMGALTLGLRHPHRHLRLEFPDPCREAGLFPLLQRKAQSLTRFRLDESERLVRGFLAFLDRTRPHTVVLQDEVSSRAQALVFACRQRGIRTLALQHGVIHPYHFGYHHDRRDFQAWPGALIPDLTLVFGEYFRRVLVEYGHYPPSRVLVTGCPRYDGFRALRAAGRDAGFLAGLGIRDPRLVVATTQPLTSRQAFLDALVEALLDRPDCALVIKPHPGETDLVPHHRAAARMGRRAQVLPQVDLNRLLGSADAMVSCSSTTVLEALAAGAPVVTVNFEGAPEILPFAASGACQEVASPSGLHRALADLLDHGPSASRQAASEAFLADMLGGLDGRAGERVCQILRAKDQGTGGEAPSCMG